MRADAPLRCPRCRDDLAIVGGPDWQMYECAGCRGLAVTVALLRRIAPEDRVGALWRRLAAGSPGDPCPSCSRPLTTVTTEADERPLQLDLCRRCQLIWFDATELARFSPERQEPPAPPAADADLSPKARRALAGAKVAVTRQVDDALGGVAAVPILIAVALRLLLLLMR